MVDYYPLLNRAIASLELNDAETRSAIYGRAKGALERQLRGFEPPLAEEDIQSQLETLAAVIDRIEREQQAAAAPPPALDLATLLEPLPPAPNFGSAKDSPADTLPPVPPLAPIPAAEMPEPAAGPETPPGPPPFDLKPFRHPASGAVPDGQPDRPQEGPEELPEPVIEPVLRPRMPTRNQQPVEPGRRKLFVFAGIGIVAMLAMGLLAMTRMNRPATQAGPPVITAPAETGTDPAKTEGRLANAEPQPNSQVAPPAGGPATPPGPAPSPGGNAQPAAPPRPDGTVVTQSTIGKAFMVLEPAPNGPNQFEGKTTWSYAPDNAIGGQKSLRALIEFPASALSVDLSIARNTDAGLGASHIVMVLFDGRNGLGNVLEMSAIEWRERENVVGGILNGTIVPIQANVFMIGLDKAEAMVARNLDLLRTQRWMVFEFRLENGRRGAVLVEKALGGEKAVADALRDWR